MPLRVKLSKTMVDALGPREAEYVVYDEDVKRLALRVYPTGRKVYLVRMRVDGRQKWYTIGAHGDPWTTDTARDEAQRVIGQAANVTKLRETGAAPASLLHPVESRDRQRGAKILADFAALYLSDYAVPHKRPASVQADRSLLGLREGNEGHKPGPRTILASLGTRRVDRITRPEVTAYHLSLKDTPTRANRALALLSHMFAMAEKWNVRTDGSNPCRYVTRFPETKRERFLSLAELARLGKALAAAEKANKVTPFGLAAIRLLVFTGARAGEMLGLRWQHADGCLGHVDVTGGVAELHQSKTGAKAVRLPPPALAVLKTLPRVEDNPHVIAGGRRGRPLTIWGVEQCWQEVRRAAKLEDVRLHDLRHSFAAVAAGSGQSLPVIGALLGHSQAQTTKRYAHLADDPLRAAAKAVAGRIASAMRTRSAKDNLRAMRGRR